MRTLTLAQFHNEQTAKPVSERKTIERGNSNVAETCSKVAALMPCHVEVQERTYNEGTYFEYSAAAMLTGHPIEVRYDDYTKKFHFSLTDVLTFKNVSNYNRDSAYKAFERPQQVGTLTVKKIQAWIDYLTLVRNNIAAVDAKNAETIAEFKASLEGLPVKWYKNRNAGDNSESGRIHTNGIVFEFTINEGFISKKIELYYKGGASVETFKALSDNKYLLD